MEALDETEPCLASRSGSGSGHRLLGPVMQAEPVVNNQQRAG